jgi:hypothetical protein
MSLVNFHPSTRSLEHSNAESLTHARDKFAARNRMAMRLSGEEFKVASLPFSCARNGDQRKVPSTKLFTNEQILTCAGLERQIESPLGKNGFYFKATEGGVEQLSNGHAYEALLKEERAKRSSYHALGKIKRKRKSASSKLIRLTITMLPAHSAFLRTLPTDDQKIMLTKWGESLMHCAAKACEMQVAAGCVHTDSSNDHADVFLSRYICQKDGAVVLAEKRRGIRACGIAAASAVRHDAAGHPEAVRDTVRAHKTRVLASFRKRYDCWPLDLVLMRWTDRFFRKELKRFPGFQKCIDAWYCGHSQVHQARAEDSMVSAAKTLASASPKVPSSFIERAVANELTVIDVAQMLTEPGRKAFKQDAKDYYNSVMQFCEINETLHAELAVAKSGRFDPKPPPPPDTRKEAEIEGLHAKVRDLEKEMSSLRFYFEEARNQNIDHEHRAFAERLAISRLETVVSALQTKNEGMAKEQYQLQEQVRSKQKELDAQAAQLSSLEKERDTLARAARVSAPQAPHSQSPVKQPGLIPPSYGTSTVSNPTKAVQNTTPVRAITNSSPAPHRTAPVPEALVNVNSGRMFWFANKEFVEKTGFDSSWKVLSYESAPPSIQATYPGKMPKGYLLTRCSLDDIAEWLQHPKHCSLWDDVLKGWEFYYPSYVKTSRQEPALTR